MADSFTVEFPGGAWGWIRPLWAFLIRVPGFSFLCSAPGTALIPWGNQALGGSEYAL